MERTRTYDSDLADGQWGLVEPLLPLINEPGQAPKHPRRDMVDAFLYVVRVGGFVAAVAGGLPAVADGVLAVQGVGETAGHCAAS